MLKVEETEKTLNITLGDYFIGLIKPYTVENIAFSLEILTNFYTKSRENELYNLQFINELLEENAKEKKRL